MRMGYDFVVECGNMRLPADVAEWLPELCEVGGVDCARTEMTLPYVSQQQILASTVRFTGGVMPRPRGAG